MADYFIYNHGGSANHGCEAIVRTILTLFQGTKEIPVYSEAIQQDLRYGIDAPLKTATTSYAKTSIGFWRAYWQLKMKKDYVYMDALPYRRPIKQLNINQVELSIGGDIYCYDDYRKYILLHKQIVKQECRSVLLGCSLEEKLFQDPAFLRDLRDYDYISARESITFDMLRRAGFKHIGLSPDSAFTLEGKHLPLPKGFLEGNTVGINISPLVARKETEPDIVFKNFVYLVRYILDNTNYSVALIPHVVWQDNDDRTILKRVYVEVNCPERVVLIQDCNCMELKGFISRCRFFVGARTHATIAAYSTLVPTLVVGYSTKSRGIAKDLFGTDKHYVIPVQELRREDKLTDSFRWIEEYEDMIRDRLRNIMPEYIGRAMQIPEKVRMALECNR